MVTALSSGEFMDLIRELSGNSIIPITVCTNISKNYCRTDNPVVNQRNKRCTNLRIVGKPEWEAAGSVLLIAEQAGYV